MDIVKDTKIVMLPIEQLVNNDGQIAGVPKNPRVISDERYRALVRRLKKSNLTGVIPLKVYEQDGVFVVLSGNQRLKALRQLKAAEVPCIIVPKDADAETLREIVVLENVNDGEWDGLENWNADELEEWGVEVKSKGKGTLQENEIGDEEFAEIMNEENNYIVLQFKTDVDWLQAEDFFGLESKKCGSYRKDGKINKKNMRSGIARVLDGVKCIEKIVERYEGVN